MHIKRVILNLTFVNGVLYGTRNFKPDYIYTHNFIDTWNVDEIVLLDITKKNEGNRKNFYKVLKSFSLKCFVPIAAGGNINNTDEIKKLLNMGADKVIINTALKNENFIKKAVKIFGSSTIIGSVDCKKKNNNYEVYINRGEKIISKNCNKFSKKIESLGVGEILVQSIDRDGSLQGYDLKLIKEIENNIKIPILVSSGAGKWEHFYECFKQTKASGVCVTNIFHFSEKSMIILKNYLKKNKINTRTIKKMFSPFKQLHNYQSH